MFFFSEYTVFNSLLEFASFSTLFCDKGRDIVRGAAADKTD